jgi:sugar lactone lactonase YvrE
MSGLRFELVATIPAHCVLGEGPVWDGRIGALWFTDIQQAQLLRLDWPSKELTRFPLPERLGSLGLTDDPARLVCAFASGFAWFEPAIGRCRWIVRTEPEYRGIRMNDGRVDRAGRFWAGSMVEDESLAPPERGSLYRLDRGDYKALNRLCDGISISNSICFTAAGDELYFADTPKQEIRVFDCDPATGELGNSCRFASLTGEAFPDGSDTDATGRVWNAEWGTGRVTVYGVDGTIEAKLDLPVSQATCIAFGGSGLDHLFVTSAREGLTDEQLRAEPDAGNVFVYRTNALGLSAPIFGG